MTRDDIIRMAREAGWSGIYAKPLISILMQEEDFLRFAALVVAAEREACAKLCEETTVAEPKQLYTHVGEHCAATIRARGEK